MATADSNSNPAGSDISRSTVSIPEDISSPTAKLVYLYVHSVGRTTLEELRASTNLKQLTLLGILPILINRGYITRKGETLFASDD